MRTIRPFSSHPGVREIAIALPEADALAPPSWLRSLANDNLKLVAGGETRARSVRNAVRLLDRACAVVLVHDAARPFVSREVIDKLIERARSGVCCIAAVPMSDTVKRADKDNVVVETVDRTDLWRAQTPQGFPVKVLMAAYDAWGDELADATDEAALVERLGLSVELIPDDPGNFKLTTPRDFEIAERLVN